MTHTIALGFPRNPIAVAAIRFYQTWISPRKGFHCIHNAVHGQKSCSSYGLQVFSSHSFGTAWQLLRARLRECRQTYNAAVAAQPADRRKRRKRVPRFLGGSARRTGGTDVIFCSGDELAMCDDIGSCSIFD